MCNINYFFSVARHISLSRAGGLIFLDFYFFFHYIWCSVQQVGPSLCFTCFFFAHSHLLFFSMPVRLSVLTVKLYSFPLMYRIHQSPIKRAILEKPNDRGIVGWPGAEQHLWFWKKSIFFRKIALFGKRLFVGEWSH